MNVLLIGPPRTGTTYAYSMLSSLLPDHEPVGKDDFRLMDDDKWVPAGQRSSTHTIRRHIARLQEPEPWILAGADYLVQDRARSVAATLGPTLVVQTVRNPTSRLRSVWSYYRFNKGLIPAYYDLDEFLRRALGAELQTGYPVVDECVADCHYHQRLAPWLWDLAGPGQVVAQVATEDLDQALPKLLAEFGLMPTDSITSTGRSHRSGHRGGRRDGRRNGEVPRNATTVPRSARLNRLSRQVGEFVPAGWPPRRWLAAAVRQVLDSSSDTPDAELEDWMVDIVERHPQVAAGHDTWMAIRNQGGFRLCSPP